jgi:amino acid transporter
LVLEFLALIVLRVREPNMPRPFRVPGGLFGAVLVSIGPIALLAFALIRNRSEHLELGKWGSISTLSLGGILMALGVVYYFAAGRPRPELQSVPAD